MLEAVSRQSRAFWEERKLRTPDWWGQLPLVPFRELCAEELSQATGSSSGGGGSSGSGSGSSSSSGNNSGGNSGGVIVISVVAVW